MKKSDIKNGMHVITKDGSEYIIMSNVGAQNQTTTCEIAMINLSNGWMPFDEYDDNLRHIDDDDDRDDSYDIKEVYAPKHYADTVISVLSRINKCKFVKLWERPIPKKMTKAEIEAELGYEIEIIESED